MDQTETPPVSDDDPRFDPQRPWGGNMISGVIEPSFISAKALATLQAQFAVRESDVFVLTFPKAGTTLTQQVIHLLRHNGEQPPVTMMDAVPWLESVFSSGKFTLEQLEAMPEPRIFKSHASPHLFPGDWTKPRVILVTRNPKDTLVSMYYHMIGKKIWEYTGDWDDYWNNLVRKNRIESNDFFSWTLPWWQRYQSNQFRKCLWLHYEDAMRDMRTFVKSIADFLDMDVSDEVIDKTAAASKLDAMKCNPYADCAWIGTRDQRASHLRQGGSGNWRDMFTDEQNAEFEGLYKAKMEGTGLRYDFGDGVMV